MNIPLGKWSGSDATEALHETIREFNRQSSQQTAQMLWLTKVIAVLTVIMLVGLAVQIYIAVRPVTQQPANNANIPASADPLHETLTPAVTAGPSEPKSAKSK